MAQSTPHTSSSNKSPAAGQTIGSGPDDGISKVRDILFGAKIKEQNEKFEALQSKLESRLTTLRDEQVERFNVLEKYTKEEVKALTHLLEDEKAERDRAFAKLSKTIDDVQNEFEKRMAYMASDNSKTTSELRNFVLTCTKDLSEQIHSAQKKFAVEMHKELRLLNDHKVNRSLIVELLHDWSARIGESSADERH